MNNSENRTKIIKEVYFSSNPADKYDYTYVDVRFEDGEKEFFHYHKNNPFPKRDEIIGLTWVGLQGLYLKMFHEALRK